MSSLSWILPPNTIMPFIDDETASALEMDGLLSPAVENKRQLSTKVFALSSGALPPSQHHRVSSGTRSFTKASAVSQPVETITIPDRMGPAAYEFMGLTAARAKRVWDGAFHKADPHRISIPDWALLHVESREDVDDWDAYYLRAGINAELTAAILDPQFADLRGTASPKHWLKEVFRARYQFLNELGERARVALERLHGSGTGPERPSRDGDGDSTVAELPAWPPYPASSLSATRPMDGYKVLWRAGYKAQTLSLVKATGELSTRNMASQGDFGRRKAVYLTPDRALADRYAAFYKTMSAPCDVVVARVLVPDEHLAKLKVAHQSPSFEQQQQQQQLDDEDNDTTAPRDWRAVVLAARSRPEPPSPHDVLVGPILSAPTLPLPLHRPERPLSCRDILLHTGLDDHRAAQWCFASSTGIALLRSLGAGLVTFFPVGAGALPPRDADRDLVVDRPDGWVVTVRGSQRGLDPFGDAQFKAMCGAWEFR